MKRRNLIRIKTKKGFTMVELLGTIVILGILTTISILGIQRLLSTAKEKYYESQEQALISAVRSFVEKNKQYLPKLNGQISNITLRTVIKAKYIDKVVDYNKNPCSEDDSFVQVFYYDKDYYYTPYLKCDNWHSKEIANSQDIEINLSFSGKINDAKLNYTVKDETNGLATYYYTIYKDNKQVFTSERYIVNNEDVINKTVELTDYTPGVIKVVMTGVSKKGKSKTESATKEYTIGDATEMIRCGTASGGSTSWTTGNRTITIPCLEGTNGIKCARDTYTKTFTTSMKEGTIKISDREGNEVNCPVNVYIDKGQPTVSAVNVTSRASGYNSRNVRVSVTAQDTVSGLKSICYSLTNNASGCNWKNVSGTDATATWDITMSQGDGSGASQTFYGFAKDNAENISPAKSKNYTLYTYCSQLGGYKCGKSSPTGNVGYYTDINNVCNQPGTNNGWGLKLVNCPYFDKYFPTYRCSQMETRACPCDTWNSDPGTLAFSSSQRAPDCNWLYCRDDICKPSYCFDTGNRGNPNCHD